MGVFAVLLVLIGVCVVVVTWLHTLDWIDQQKYKSSLLQDCVSYWNEFNVAFLKLDEAVMYAYNPDPEFNGMLIGVARVIERYRLAKRPIGKFAIHELQFLAAKYLDLTNRIEGDLRRIT